jgi:hypothetical protein
MSMGGKKVPVFVPLMRYRLAPLLLIAGACSLLSLSICAVATVRGSIDTAIETSVRAQAGQSEFTVQAGSSDARAALGRVKQLTPIRDSQAEIDAGDARANTSLRALRSDGPILGTIVEGDAPSADGEASISQSVADDLNLQLGNKVTLVSDGNEPARVTVVGITVNTADNADATTVVIDSTVSSRDATVWVSSVDPYSLPQLTNLMDARSITYSPTSSVIESSRSELPVNSAALNALQYGLGGLLLIVILSLLFLLRPTAVRDVAALVDVGMTPRKAVGITARIVFAWMVLGFLAGFVVEWSLMRMFREPVSALFGQQWIAVDVPFIELAFFVVVTACCFLAARPLYNLMADKVRLSPLNGVISASIGPTASTALVGIGIGLMAIVVIGSRRNNPPEFISAAALPGALLVVVGLPGLMERSHFRARGTSFDAVRRRLSVGFVGAVVAAAAVVLWSSSVAAESTHNANAFEGETGPSQPAGSLVMTEVPSGAGDLIVDQYELAGGVQIAQFDLPIELHHQLRVTGTKLVKCMEAKQTRNPDDVSPGCFPQRTSVPVAIVALAHDPGAPAATADPGLIEDGVVGLLDFKTGQAGASRLADTDATPSPLLGGNFPGMVVSPTSEVAKAFNLRPSGTRLIGLLDFGKLSKEDRARIRSVIAQSAPAAQVAESSEVGAYDQERGRATGVAAAGAIVASILLLVGGGAVVVAHRRTRRTLADIGVTTEQRLRLVTLWVAVPIITNVAACVLAITMATSLGVRNQGSFGWAWMLPGASVMLCSVILLVAMLRIPSRTIE